MSADQGGTIEISDERTESRDRALICLGFRVSRVDDGQAPSSGFLEGLGSADDAEIDAFESPSMGDPLPRIR